MKPEPKNSLNSRVIEVLHRRITEIEKMALRGAETQSDSKVAEKIRDLIDKIVRDEVKDSK